MAKKRAVRKSGQKSYLEIIRNKNGSKTLIKGTRGKNAKAVSVFYPKKSKKGKVLVTVKRWVSVAQSKKY